MRIPTIARQSRIVASSVVMAATLLATTGCALLRSTVGAYEVGPNGIAIPQQRLRDALARADFREALASRDDDALLQALNLGASSYYASQFARSAAVLDSAALIADDRITASVSKNALSLMTNDMARAYQPRRTERLFIPYYSMLAYVRLEQWEDAAVEARRLSALLSQYAADRTDDERATHATLHYLAGAVFERAGERGEATVAYRNARALMSRADSDLTARGNADGDVLVVVERGFIAHRTTESINVFLGGADRDSLRGDDREARVRTASSLADRVSRIVSASGAATGDETPPYKHRARSGDDDEDDHYWLSIALPSLRRSLRVAGNPAVFIDGTSVASWRVSTLIDDAAAADEHRERATLLTRAMVRAATKYAVTQAVADKKGDVAGSIANIGASLLERADIRSWHLLPQEITLIRVRAPAGQRTMQLAIGDGSARIDRGPITVRTGQTTITTVRLWQEPAPAVIAVR
ncbi:MAG: hypothetical protein ABJE10_01835 [bacterium]